MAFGGHTLQVKELRTPAHEAVVSPRAVGQAVVALRQSTLQTGAAVAIEHSRQHRQGQGVLVFGGVSQTGQARHFEGQCHIGLLGRRFEVKTAQALLGRFDLRFALRHGAGGDRAIVFFGQRLDLQRVDITGHHHHRIGGRVPLAVKISGVLRCHGFQIAHPTDDGTAVGRSRQGGGREHFVQLGAGVVIGAQAALFFHHLQLFGKFGIGPLVVGKAV